MAYNTSFDASNKADFIIDISATNSDTGADIDFTGAAVAIAISEIDTCCTRFNATIGNGITQPSATVLELTIPATVMASLKPGSYQIDGIFRLSGGTSDLIIGTISVYNVAASL
jgi:hypothetical protein